MMMIYIVPSLRVILYRAHDIGQVVAPMRLQSNIRQTGREKAKAKMCSQPVKVCNQATSILPKASWKKCMLKSNKNNITPNTTKDGVKRSTHTPAGYNDCDAWWEKHVSGRGKALLYSTGCLLKLCRDGARWVLVGKMLHHQDGRRVNLPSACDGTWIDHGGSWWRRKRSFSLGLNHISLCKQ